MRAACSGERCLVQRTAHRNRIDRVFGNCERVEMKKRKLKLSARIPPYRSPRNTWRRDIHESLMAAAESSSVNYDHSDKLQIVVTLYMPEASLHSHDIDNRLKDIMDALQGRCGGPKAIHSLRAIIPNDRQVYRVTILKKIPPKQNKGYGRIIITKLGLY